MMLTSVALALLMFTGAPEQQKPGFDRDRMIKAWVDMWNGYDLNMVDLLSAKIRELPHDQDAGGASAFIAGNPVKRRVVT